MKMTELRNLKQFCTSLLSDPDWREVVNNIVNEIECFEVAGVRFIHTDIIDSVLADELESDEYVLGCFNPEAISEATGWPVALIKAVQDADQFQAIGEGMSREQVEKLVEIYVGADGYGHHFNSYDGSEETITLSGFGMYHVFDNH